MEEEKEHNNQPITDLFYMINAGKELEENMDSQFQNPINNQYINLIGNIDKEDLSNKSYEIKDLEREVQNLKNIINSFEENYGYISPYHDDIMNKLKEKNLNRNLTTEISKTIYELYQNKFYNDCYDLWSIYGFKLLFNLSPEENFEILRHLTKVRNEISKRKYILQNLDNFNFLDDNNLYFETGISFKQIHNKQNINISNNNNYNYSQMKNNINLNDESLNLNSEDIVKQKIKDNNLMLEKIKKRNLNFSYH